MSIAYCHYCENYIDTDFAPMVGEICEWCSYEREQPTPSPEPGALLTEFIQGLNRAMHKGVVS